MFLSNIFVCVLVLYNSEFVYTKRCNDCVKLLQCQGARDIEDFKINSICGYEDDSPKVCCSDFHTSDDNVVFEHPNEALDHPNVALDHPNEALLPTECGNIDSRRIIGDSVAGLYEFPWMVLLSYTTRHGIQIYRCGGSVINARYVLASAHCISSSLTHVRVGEHDMHYLTDCQLNQRNLTCESHLQDIAVESAIVHPQYQSQRPIKNDIALIRLKEPIDFSYKNAGPVCLPITETLRRVSLGVKSATVVGWKAENKTSLLKSDLTIITNDVCHQYYNRNEARTDIDDNIICASTLEGDFCNFDLDGPLVIADEYKGVQRLIQYGISSYGPRRCRSTYPIVYTDVSKFTKWILDNIKP